MAKKQYWLMKSDPEEYDFEDLKKDGETYWDGIRNYAARIHLRNMKKGDGVLFYHSNAKPPAVVGTATVTKEAYPDHTQFDKKNKHYDAKSSKDDPRWDMVDIQFDKEFKNQVSLNSIKETEELQNMALIKITRLSVSPVTSDEWKTIIKMGGKK